MFKESCCLLHSFIHSVICPKLSTSPSLQTPKTSIVFIESQKCYFLFLVPILFWTWPRSCIIKKKSKRCKIPARTFIVTQMFMCLHYVNETRILCSSNSDYAYSRIDLIQDMVMKNQCLHDNIFLFQLNQNLAVHVSVATDVCFLWLILGSEFSGQIKIRCTSASYKQCKLELCSHKYFSECLWQEIRHIQLGLFPFFVLLSTQGQNQ